MNPDGTNKQELTQTARTSELPDFSPDGSLIAFDGAFGGGNYNIEVMNADGSNIVALTGGRANDFGPFWSPDGSMIAYTSTRSGDRDVWVMTSAGGSETNLTHHPGGDDSPSWQPT